jgi:hypothetical protein
MSRTDQPAVAAMHVEKQFFAYAFLRTATGAEGTAFCLLDNGAMVSLMSQTTYLALGQPFLEPAGLRVSGGPAVQFSLRGCVEVDIVFEDMPRSRSKHTFGVVDDLPYELLVGNDFFNPLAKAVGLDHGLAMKRWEVSFNAHDHSWALADVRGPIAERRSTATSNANTDSEIYRQRPHLRPGEPWHNPNSKLADPGGASDRVPTVSQAAADGSHDPSHVSRASGPGPHRRQDSAPHVGAPADVASSANTEPNRRASADARQIRPMEFEEGAASSAPPPKEDTPSASDAAKMSDPPHATL